MFGNVQVHPAVAAFVGLVENDALAHTQPLPAIAKRLGVSTSHLQHLVKRDLRMTCGQLIQKKSVDRFRAHLLAHPEQTIAEAAYVCGYEPQTVYRYFYAVLGTNPGTVRRDSRK